ITPVVITSDTDGSYSFETVVPGSYILQEANLPGYVSTTPDEIAFSAAPGGIYVVFFGDARPVQISGVVFSDENANGKRDPQEPGIAGVKIQLYQDNVPLDSWGGEDSLKGAQFTDAEGRFLFSDLRPGRYVLAETDPPGFTSTNGNLRFLKRRSDVSSVDEAFGDVQPGSIGGTAWFDINGNGQRDAQETKGIGYVPVRLFGPIGLVDVTTTKGGTGAYLFTPLLPSVYTITIDTPPGLALSTPGQVVVNLPSGHIYNNVNFGFLAPTAVDLQMFTAQSVNGKVLLRWRTLSEVDITGFDIYRAQNAKGPGRRINPTTLPAQGNESRGAPYQFQDEKVVAGRHYWYWLQTTPDSTRYGPTAVTVMRRVNYQLYLPFLPR
ncbi:MAG TPA: hypothetical protein EYP04_06445, partial [Anaerolineae bacterium]|nr:hypothetical protein [Anaerolineae bacterium]